MRYIVGKRGSTFPPDTFYVAYVCDRCYPGVRDILFSTKIKETWQKCWICSGDKSPKMEKEMAKDHIFTQKTRWEERLILELDSVGVYECMKFNGRDEDEKPINPFPYVQLILEKFPVELKVTFFKEEVQKLIGVLTTWLDSDVVQDGN